MTLYEQILRQLQLEERPPTFYETGVLPADRYPRLHELQLEELAAENNRRWAEERAERLCEHDRRVRQHLRRHSRRPPPGQMTNGRRQRVWCVELRRRFDSLSEAARFVGRAPSNVLQAIRCGVRCGGFAWERYDPARHGAAASEAETGCVRDAAPGGPPSPGSGASSAG
jgi:hypothetical protein